jgi:prevent-host-death family protein
VGKTVTLHEAETQLSRLVDEAAAGNEVVIAKAGKPMARLVALEAPEPARKPGGWEGQVWIADDFDDDLPPEVLAGFLGEEASAEER